MSGTRGTGGSVRNLGKQEEPGEAGGTGGSGRNLGKREEPGEA